MTEIQEVRLVKATKEDIPLLLDLLGQLFKLEADFFPNPGVQAAALGTILANPEQADFYTIKVGEEVAGIVALHLCISTAEGGWCGRIEDFYLSPEFRRRGIGTRVIEELQGIASGRALKRLTLLADKNNMPALQFYASCGFEEMNLVCFVKRLSPGAERL